MDAATHAEAHSVVIRLGKTNNLAVCMQISSRPRVAASFCWVEYLTIAGSRLGWKHSAIENGSEMHTRESRAR